MFHQVALPPCLLEPRNNCEFCQILNTCSTKNRRRAKRESKRETTTATHTLSMQAFAHALHIALQHNLYQATPPPATETQDRYVNTDTCAVPSPSVGVIVVDKRTHTWNRISSHQAQISGGKKHTSCWGKFRASRLIFQAIHPLVAIASNTSGEAVNPARSGSTRIRCAPHYANSTRMHIGGLA